MYGNVTRSFGQVNYEKISVNVPRCVACKKKHSNSDKLGCGLAMLAIIIGALIGGVNDGNGVGGVMVGVLLGAIIYLIFTTIVNSINGYNKFKKYPAIVDMIRNGWAIGEKPS